MNRFVMIQRLRWPAMLLLFGVNAMLNEWDILPFSKSWPLYLILWGLFKLAERAALTNEEYPAYQQPVTPYAYAPTGSAIVPAHDASEIQTETPGNAPGDGRQ